MARIDQLVSFCKVVDLGSFTQAGEELGLSQPTISLQVKALEEEYGTPLLHREGHKVLATENGAFVYEHLTKIIALFEHSIQGVKNTRIGFRTPIRIGASSGPGEHPIPVIMASFKLANPDAIVSLHVGDSNEIMDKVSNQSLDLGFVGAKRRDGSLSFHPFIEDELVFVVPRTSEYAHKLSVSYQELREIPIILQQTGSGATTTLKHALTNMQYRISDLKIIMQLGLQESVKAAVMAGYGSTIISSLGIKKELDSGELIQIEIDDLDLRRQIYFCQNRRIPLSNIAQQFISFANQYKKT